MHLKYSFLVVLALVSCNNANELKWQRPSGEFVEYAILEKGKTASTGKVSVKFFGHLQSDQIYQDNIDSISRDLPLSQRRSDLLELLGERLEKFKLPIGTVGYCRINISKFMDSLMKGFKLTVFLKPSFKESDSTIEIQKLRSYNLFDSIQFNSREKMYQQWVKSGNEDFKQFIDNDLLPMSIELKLNDRYLNQQTADSIKEIFRNDPNYDEVSFPEFIKNFRSDRIKRGDDIVFKFVVY